MSKLTSEIIPIKSEGNLLSAVEFEKLRKYVNMGIISVYDPTYNYQKDEQCLVDTLTEGRKIYQSNIPDNLGNAVNLAPPNRLATPEDFVKIGTYLSNFFLATNMGTPDAFWLSPGRYNINVSELEAPLPTSGSPAFTSTTTKVGYFSGTGYNWEGSSTGTPMPGDSQTAVRLRAYLTRSDANTDKNFALRVNAKKEDYYLNSIICIQLPNGETHCLPFPPTSTDVYLDEYFGAWTFINDRDFLLSKDALRNGAENTMFQSEFTLNATLKDNDGYVIIPIGIYNEEINGTKEFLKTIGEGYQTEKVFDFALTFNYYSKWYDDNKIPAPEQGQNVGYTDIYKFKFEFEYDKYFNNFPNVIQQAYIDQGYNHMAYDKYYRIRPTKITGFCRDTDVPENTKNVEMQKLLNSIIFEVIAKTDPITGYGTNNWFVRVRKNPEEVFEPSQSYTVFQNSFRAESIKLNTFHKIDVLSKFVKYFQLPVTDHPEVPAYWNGAVNNYEVLGSIYDYKGDRYIKKSEVPVTYTGLIGINFEETAKVYNAADIFPDYIPGTSPNFLQVNVSTHTEYLKYRYYWMGDSTIHIEFETAPTNAYSIHIIANNFQQMAQPL